MTKFTVNGDRAELYVPLAKFDERTGEFEAWATVDELDRHREICDVEKSWPAIVEDAQEQAKNSGGKSVGNLRRQHKRGEVIGKRTLVELRERDGVPAVFIKGKVTDDKAKADAAEGVLTGVSIRGLATRWPDENIEGAKRYAWTMVEEFSLVDRPAVPHALIEVMKSSGEVEMVKAVGRDVTQYWDCKQPGCESKHSRKEEAQKCEMPEGEGAPEIPTKIEVTEKSASPTAADVSTTPSTGSKLTVKVDAADVAAKVKEALKAETGVLLEKCLDCAASVAYLIQRATMNRPPMTCTCVGTCYCYHDPGHEEMEAGVKQLWDALRAMVNDMRSKWMSDEGVSDDMPMDVGKMLDHLNSQIRNTEETLKSLLTPEVIKSLRVPTGNGSSNTNATQEGTMAAEEKKGHEATPASGVEGTGDGELAKSVASLQTQVGDIVARLDKATSGEDTAKALSGITEHLTTIAGRIEEMSKSQSKIEELEKGFGDLKDGFEALINALPVSRKGNLRAADKATETADTTEAAKAEESKTGNPFIDLVSRVV